MKKVIPLVLLTVFINLTSCNNKAKSNIDYASTKYHCPMKCEGDKVYSEPGTCSICKMDLTNVVPKIKKTNEISDMSIYNLPSVWTNQNNQEIELIDLKGNILVMVMIYTSCQVACPRLAADMRNIENKIPVTIKDKVKMVLVSIDPETDTPERLKQFAIENEMNSDRWVLLRGSESDTREFAAVLAVSYKQISPLDFSHSNIISVFNQVGELAYQKEGLGVSQEETINEILKLSN